VVIAGDAAHLMPPFAGQGMCSGIRDCANLAWKLDLVLSGRAGDALLDTYTSERSAHIQNAIGMSVELGNVICLTDPAAVAARDEVMLKAEGRPEVALPPIPPPVLGPGVLSVTADGAPAGVAGQLSPQGLVRSAAGTTGLFDQVTGTGFVLLGRGESIKNIDESARASLAELGAHVVRVLPPDAEPAADAGAADADADGTWNVVDVDGRYQQWLDAVGYEAVVIRPDFYVFGGVASADELPALLDELFGQLELVSR
jgi:flavoprotein hydroxylase